MKPTRQHITGGIATAVLLLALLLGSVLAHNLLVSGASVKTAIGQDFGAKQAVAHQQGATTAPFPGPYRYAKGRKFQCGPGVHLLGGALIKEHAYPKAVKKAPSCYGPGMKAAVVTYQKRIHYKPTGTYNLVTHEYLVKHGGYTTTAKAGLVFLYQQKVAAAHLVLVQHERAEIKVIALHAARVGGNTLIYSQGSERGYFPAWPRIPPATDCSGMSTWVLYEAGAGATIGYYGPGSPVGWTGTLRYQGRHISTTDTRYLYPGDLIFYHGWGHVAVYIGGGLVVSHGTVGVHIESYRYSTIDEIRRYIA